MDITEKATAEIGTETETPQERTFTQSELDKIVQKRVAEERANIDELKEKASKFDEMEEANKTELEKAHEKAEELQKKLDSLEQANKLNAIKQKISEETGVDARYLNGNSEEECRAIAGNFIAYAEANKTPVAPTVKDGGEPNKPTYTKESILAIKSEKERLKAIQENIDLF